LSSFTVSTPAAQTQVLGHGHLGEDGVLLWHEGDPQAQKLLGSQSRDLGAGEGHPAAGERREPADGAQQGRLAGAVGADDRGDRAGGGLEIDAAEDLDVALVGDAQPLHPQRLVGHSAHAR
jgi:hypothetical protein